MEHGLFFCDASSITLGSSGTFTLHWNPKDHLDDPLEILSSDLVKDEFGDESTVVHLAYPKNHGVPIKKMRYRNRCGETGFADFTTPQGASADEEVRRLFWSLMDDAWTWDIRLGRFVSFAEQKFKLSYPNEFLVNRPPRGPRLAFHSPDAKMLETFEHAAVGSPEREESDKVRGSPPATGGYGLYGIDALSKLLSTITSCRAITNWQAAYGDNPVLVAANIQEVLKWLAELCRAEPVPLRMVSDENSLPAW
jgi:hypothetical protein